MKIVTILGARPQFVKASVLSLEFAKHADIEECIVHTGQHFNKNMSDIFFQEMGIPEPSYNLGINSLSHGAMTGRMLEEIEKVIQKEKADWVLVYGDTNSTLATLLLHPHALPQNLKYQYHVMVYANNVNVGQLP